MKVTRGRASHSGLDVFQEIMGASACWKGVPEVEVLWMEYRISELGRSRLRWLRSQRS
jgi:hypothetical protein